MAEAHHEPNQPKGTRQGKTRGKKANTNGAAAPPEAPNILNPEALPPGCPPADAFDGPIQLYRLSADKKPAASDCLTPHDRGAYLTSDPCLRRSLSSYKDRVDAERVRARVTHFKDHHVCKGVVPAGEGVHLATPSTSEKSHHSWWPRKGADRHQHFKAAL
jgi:hypothetical protein